MPAFNQDRIVPGAAAILLQFLLGYALIVGLGVAPGPKLADAIAVFDVAPAVVAPPPAPKSVPVRARTPRPKGAAALPNRRSVATPIVAPLPEIRIDRPALIVAAPLPGVGADPTAGAAPVAGPGSGAGGQGSGTGSGDSGIGDGGGGGTPAEFLRGRIRGDRDYPRAPKLAGIGGALTTRYLVGSDGRVKTCTVIRSSGNADLDTTTCRLVVERFRYVPARDATGRKVSDVVIDEHRWGVSDEPRPDDDRDPS